MFVHFTTFNTKHNPPKTIRYIAEKNGISMLFRGFKMHMKMSFMVLEIWLSGFGKVLEGF